MVSYVAGQGGFSSGGVKYRMKCNYFAFLKAISCFFI